MAGPTTVKKRQPKRAATRTKAESRHCGWCGNYLPPGQAFCSPYHHALQVEREADDCAAAEPSQQSEVHTRHQ
jgi:hypothetical protein